MTISKTYRLIASALSLSILIGVSFPAGLHLQSQQMCDSMQKDLHASHEMPKSMEHSESHDFGFTCACSVEEAPVKTEAPVYNKVKVQVLAVVQVLKEDHTNQTEFDNFAIQTSDSYSPPPIFLANESFLI